MADLKYPECPDMIREARRTGGRNLFVEILIFVLVFFIGEMLESIPVAVATVIWVFTADTQLWDEASFDTIYEDLTRATESTPVMLTQLFATVLMTLTVICFCRWIQHRSAASVGFRHPGALREYLWGILIGAFLLSATVGICALQGNVQIEKSAFSVPVWLLFLAGYLLQGMSEEVLCRGYFMTSLARKNHPAVAALVSAAAFSLLHLANPGISWLALVNIFLFGVLMAVYILRRKDIWGACAIHSIWNFFQGNLFGIRVSGLATGPSPLVTTPDPAGSLWNGGDFGVEAGLCTTVVLGAALLILLVFGKDRKEHGTWFAEMD